MKRPLLSLCICLIALVCIWTYVKDAPPFYDDIPIKEEEHITITGQIYQKEYRSYYGTAQTNLYLKSIQIIHSDTGQVSNLNPKYKMICEIKHVQGDRNPMAMGRKVRVSGNWEYFKHASNPGEFDAADYYAAQYISGKIKNARVEALGDSFWEVREFLFVLRNTWKDHLYEALPESDASVLAKMLLGEGGGLDAEIKELYQRNGVVHILSISGLHITLLGMGIFRLLRKCTCPILPAAMIGAVFLLLYGTMTGFGISTVRAIGMYLIHMLGIVCGRSYDLMTAVGVMMAVMICTNPRLLYQSGFLLSFASVSAVGCLYPVLDVQNLLAKSITKLQWRKRTVQGSRKWIIMCIQFCMKRCSGGLQGLWLSSSVSIFTLPIMMSFFYQVPVYSAFANLLILPFMGVLMLLGFVLMLNPALSFVAQAGHIILNGYERICLFLETCPGHIWITGRPDGWQIALYYAGLFGIIWLCRERSGESVKLFAANKRWLMGIAVLVCILNVDLAKEDKVCFLDVGQGDCIVLITKTGDAYLFDGGSSSVRNVGDKIILPFMKYHGISRINGAFLSHPDKDHMNGIIQLLQEDLIEIENVYLPDVHKDCKEEFAELLQVITDQNIIYYSAGDYLRTGNWLITCLYPESGYYGESNAYSGCFHVENGEFGVLLTGDLEGAGEKILMERLEQKRAGQVQILKAAHHGSKNSTSKELLEVSEPDLAIISCGEGNSYGHPHQEVLDRLDAEEIPYCITWERGCVMVTKDGYKWYLKKK